MNLDAAPSAILRLALPAAAVAAAALAAFVLVDRLALDQQAAERRALVGRNAELTLRALSPGSALACLDGGAGETVETACEAAVFASPQSTAAAVAYTAARLSLLADVHAFAPKDDAAFRDSFAAVRRAVELDRFGLAAHVLAWRDGCTAERCAAFAFIGDAPALKANLKLKVFEQYLSRHAAAWNAPAAPQQMPAVSEAPAAAKPAEVAATPPGHPVSDKYDFPSAASIPPVSIMNAEPALPKQAAGGNGASEPKADAGPPVPPKRPTLPKEQAATPPAR